MQVSIVAPSDQRDDAEVVAGIVEDFFAAFTSGPELDANVQRLRGWFHDEVRVVKTCGSTPVVYDADSFLSPRQQLLAGDDVVGFGEWAVVTEIRVFGDIAHSFCSYGKAGRQGATDLSGRGMKSMQLVRLSEGWRIFSVLWDDERVRLDVPDGWR